ncbi:MAG: YbaK/EbsC family protein [Xanthomonadales bacterium]|jgi:Ala-tRNA(Pro) deacylase|nr:YbaK/EbsC family protein [Xanthomonadales bacterium]
MTVAKTLHDWLDARQLPETVLRHDHTSCSSETAEAAHVPGRQLAKGVVLRTQDGYHLLVVIPADRMLSLEKMTSIYGGELVLADENELKSLFPDCETGAVPVLGMAYQLPTYVDQVLFDQDKVYFEAGDHESLLCMSGESFAELFEEPAIGEFSQALPH